MPYIKKKYRRWLGSLIEKIGILDVGELNYFITNLLIRQKPTSYKDYNSLIGVLECVKQEFYRRKVALYEDEKIEENGDLDW